MKHCETCICGRRAPVQQQYRDEKGARLKPGDPGYGPGTISWEEHLLAWSAYAGEFGTSQSAERMAERGGFGYGELRMYLGREPKTWAPR